MQQCLKYKKNILIRKKNIFQIVSTVLILAIQMPLSIAQTTKVILKLMLMSVQNQPILQLLGYFFMDQSSRLTIPCCNPCSHMYLHE